MNMQNKANIHNVARCKKFNKIKIKNKIKKKRKNVVSPYTWESLQSLYEMADLPKFDLGWERWRQPFTDDLVQ